MLKRLAVILAWVLATIGTASLTYAAVSRVGPDAGDRPGVPVASQEIAARVAATSTTVAATTSTATTSTTTATGEPSTTLPATTTSTNAATTTGAAPATTTTTASGVQTAYRTTPGGTVGVSVSGSSVSFLSAQPASGFSADVEDTGPEKVEVEFDGESAEYTVRASVVDGSLVWTVEGGPESGGGGD